MACEEDSMACEEDTAELLAACAELEGWADDEAWALLEGAALLLWCRAKDG
jgi:hypothetical protein